MSYGDSPGNGSRLGEDQQANPNTIPETDRTAVERQENGMDVLDDGEEAHVISTVTHHGVTTIPTDITDDSEGHNHHPHDESREPVSGPGNHSNDSGTFLASTASPSLDRGASAQREETVIHRCSEGRRGSVEVVDIGPGLFQGPGPAEEFPYDRLFRCFDDEGGILFRLVDDQHHTWAYYNDTKNYAVRVSVVFGAESAVEALGASQYMSLGDAADGRCCVEAVVAPEQTVWFMRGEYNGFTSTYTAVQVAKTTMAEET